MAQVRDIDSYIAAQTPDARARLRELRAAVLRAAKGAEETIKYAMPTFVLHGDLVYFAAFKRHIGLYPRVSGSATLEAKLEPYYGTKDSYRFALDEPLPVKLIEQVVKLRVKASSAAAKKKQKKR